MSPDHPRLPALEFDSFGVATGTALVAGALSLVAPFLTALTGTLAALALASWAMLRGRQTAGWRVFLPAGRAVGLGILSVGAVLFLLPPLPLAAFRGILLAFALVPLWWVERYGTAGSFHSGGGR